MATKSQTSKETKQLPRWNVILVNDNAIDISHVVANVQEIVAFSKDEALRVAMEAHEKGKALLVTTHHERAELYVEQFGSCLPPIPTRLEPA